MNYFKGFPNIVYDFSSDNESISYLLKDITRNVRFRKELLKDITLYDEYDIVDGETPEIIAEKVYGSPFYHWIVMLANERYDYIQDFPMTQNELDQYIKHTYGSLSNAINKTMYWVNSVGDVVYYDETNPTSPLNYVGNKTKVTAYDYEIKVNESKRRIKLISPKLLTTIIKNFRELM
jgi:hypothetical protein